MLGINTMKQMMIATILLMATVANADPYLSLPSAVQLNKDMVKLGSHQVLWDRIWNSDRALDQLITKVSSGDAEWLAIAVKLHEVSDAGADELLEMAMSRALARRPVNVLSILSSDNEPDKFQVEAICGGGMLYISASDAEVEKWRKKAISAVSAVDVKNLKKNRALCLKTLSE
jgi:hypothetical protein